MEAGADASTKRPLLERDEVHLGSEPSGAGRSPPSPVSAGSEGRHRGAGLPSFACSAADAAADDDEQALSQPLQAGEAAGGETCIEMCELEVAPWASSASSSRAQAVPQAAATGRLAEESLLAAPGRARGSDRHCFICLQDEDKDTPLIRCCSTCYACTHVRCWRDWRNNQRLTALRSRLLGLRMQTNHLLRCTICKSGTAVLAGEEGGLEWMNDLLCGGDAGDEAGRAATGGPMRRDDSDEDNDAQLEDLIDWRTCLALVVYLGVLVLVLLVASLLIVMQRFYAGDVVLCCIIALYELSVLQIVALAVARRRGAMVAAASSRRDVMENDVESQTNARDVPLVTA